MGYKRNKIFVLEFEGEEFAGLEVRTRGATVAGLLGVLDVVNSMEAEQQRITAQDASKVDRLFRALAGCPDGCTARHEELPDGQQHYLNRIVSWNLLDDNDCPVPATYDGLVGQDMDFALTLTMNWLEGVVGTPGPLDQNSNAGGRPAGELDPMEAVLASLSS